MVKSAPVHVIFVLVAVATASCAQLEMAKNAGTVPLPPLAYDVQRYSMGDISAQQINFKVDVSYISSSAWRFYEEFYSCRGWTECGGSNEWIEFDELIGDKEYLPTRQKLNYFFSRDSKKLILVAMRYYGRKERHLTKRPKWDDDVMHVAVVLYNKGNLRGICEEQISASDGD